MSLPRSAKVIITQEVTEYFRKSNIFQSRTWKSDPISPGQYIQRWVDGSQISVIEGAIIESHTTIHAGSALHTIGAFCDIASALPLNAVVGRFCSIAPGLRIAGFRHPIESVTCSHVVYRPMRESMHSYFKMVETRDGGQSTYRQSPIPQPQNEPLILGHDVWFGDNVVVRGGITIGNGSVVAGHSVITKSIPAYEIWGGNPARFIKKRFPDEICIGLEMIKWWDYELADLYALDLTNPGKFIENFMKDPSRARRFEPSCNHVYADLMKMQGGAS